MKLHLAKRHFFADEAGLKDVEDCLPSFERIVQNAKSFGMGDALTCYLSTPAAPDAELNDRVHLALSRIKRTGWTVSYDTNGQTAGQKFVQQLFPVQAPAGDAILAICCLDQYPLDTPSQFAQFVEIARKMTRDKTAYANGSRDVPALLGSNGHNSDLRAVHELFNTLAAESHAGKPVFRTLTPAWANPSPWYEHFGESTSGAYFTNPQGRGYDWLSQETRCHYQLFDKPGFSIEYVAAVMAGMIGSVSTGYVSAIRNPFPPNVDAGAQLKKFQKLIDVSLTDLAQTVARPALESLMRDESYRRIEEFFSPELVEEVASYARKALAVSA